MSEWLDLNAHIATHDPECYCPFVPTLVAEVRRLRDEVRDLRLQLAEDDDDDDWLDDDGCEHPWVSEDGKTKRWLGGWCLKCDEGRQERILAHYRDPANDATLREGAPRRKVSPS